MYGVQLVSRAAQATTKVLHQPRRSHSQLQTTIHKNTQISAVSAQQ